MDELGLRLELFRRRSGLRCGSLASGALFATALPLVVCGMVLPWWTGALAATNIVDDRTGVDASVGLWSFSVTTSVLDVQLGGQVLGSYSSSWDEICAAGAVSGLKCHSVRLVRFLIFVEMGTVAAALLLAAAACGCFIRAPSLLLLLLLALLSVGMAAVSVVALLVVMSIGAAGLQGAGVACHLAALLCGLAGGSMAVHAAARAGQEPLRSAGAEPVSSRMERSEKARRNSEELRQRLESFHLKKTEGAARRQPSGERRRMPALQSIIALAQAGSEDIPIPLLEAAFTEIDSSGGGKITASELAVSLRACKLNASERAVRMVMDDMDSDKSGDVDIFEFVAFFRILQDAGRNDRQKEAKGAIILWALRGLLVLHIFGLAALLMVMVKMQGIGDPRVLAVVEDTVQLLFVTFLALFAIVVLAPLLRFTLGPNIYAWQEELRSAMPFRPGYCPALLCPIWRARPEEEEEAQMGKCTSLASNEQPSPKSAVKPRSSIKSDRGARAGLRVQLPASGLDEADAGSDAAASPNSLDSGAKLALADGPERMLLPGQQEDLEVTELEEPPGYTAMDSLRSEAEPLQVGTMGSMAPSPSVVDESTLVPAKQASLVVPAGRPSLLSSSSWASLLPWRSRRSSAVEELPYDPEAFRQAAAAQVAAPRSFNLMHMPEAAIPAEQVARTGCQPQRG